MKLELNVMNVGDSVSSSDRQLNSSLLSRVAESLGEKGNLYLRLTDNPLVGLGSSLSSGTICVEGDLGYRTGNKMQGGLVCVRGNVKRIANVYGGTIYVDGDIGELANVHASAQIYCTGTIGEHVYKHKSKSPSQNIYCLKAPQNKVSLTQKELKKRTGQYHYLVKINTFIKPVEDPFENPNEIIPRIFTALAENKRNIKAK